MRLFSLFRPLLFIMIFVEFVQKNCGIQKWTA